MPCVVSWEAAQKTATEKNSGGVKGALLCHCTPLAFSHAAFGAASQLTKQEELGSSMGVKA